MLSLTILLTNSGRVTKVEVNHSQVLLLSGVVFNTCILGVEREQEYNSYLAFISELPCWLIAGCQELHSLASLCPEYLLCTPE